ncbi:hypothetical protein STXM2123_3002 [Streptomyces sp. F-3]|nr:hypothetical protein STXM2123_3002 [Streptomyces sp. F-3]
MTSPTAARRNVRRVICPQELTVFDTILCLVRTVHTYAKPSFADERPGILESAVRNAAASPDGPLRPPGRR